MIDDELITVQLTRRELFTLVVASKVYKANPKEHAAEFRAEAKEALGRAEQKLESAGREFMDRQLIGLKAGKV